MDDEEIEVRATAYKMDSPAISFIGTRLTDKSGYQVVLGAYEEPGKWPVTIQTSYSIERPRIEIAIPVGQSKDFLKGLCRNLTEAINQIEDCEKGEVDTLTQIMRSESPCAFQIMR